MYVHTTNIKLVNENNCYGRGEALMNSTTLKRFYNYFYLLSHAKFNLSYCTVLEQKFGNIIHRKG